MVLGVVAPERIELTGVDRQHRAFLERFLDPDVVAPGERGYRNAVPVDDDIDSLRSGIEVIREVCAEACVMLREGGRGHQACRDCEDSCESAVAKRQAHPIGDFRTHVLRVRPGAKKKTVEQPLRQGCPIVMDRCRAPVFLTSSRRARAVIRRWSGSSGAALRGSGCRWCAARPRAAQRHGPAKRCDRYVVQSRFQALASSSQCPPERLSIAHVRCPNLGQRATQWIMSRKCLVNRELLVYDGSGSR